MYTTAGLLIHNAIETIMNRVDSVIHAAGDWQLHCDVILLVVVAILLVVARLCIWKNLSVLGLLKVIC